MPNRPDQSSRLSLVPSRILPSPQQPQAPAHVIQVEKLAVPGSARVALLARDNLIQRLDAAGETRLMLVCAAAGYGKTTLLRQLRQHCLSQGRRVLWLTLDPADNDPERLAAHLYAGLQLLDGQALGEAIDSPQLLLQRLPTLEPGFTLMLDDFEALESPQSLAFIQQLLLALAPGVRLAIASRISPELALGRLRSQGQVVDIGSDALRLSAEQTAHFLRICCQTTLSDEHLARLQELTEGWITGLFLASLSLNGRTDLGEGVGAFSGNNQQLAEYLTEDILARQPDEVRQFLLQTSVLERFCAPLCDTLTRRSNSAELIEQLQRANLFIQAADPQRQWFRYHRLFHGFLRNAMARQSVHQVRDLHRVAAQWYLEQGYPAAAIDHLMQAGEIDQVAAALERHLDELVDAGRLRMLLRWLDQLPASILQDRPRLVLAHAWLLILDRRYRDAMQVVERNPATLETETIRCLLLAFTDQLEAAMTASRAQLARLSPSDMLQYGMVATPLAFCLVATGHYDEARTLLIHMARQAPQERSVLIDSIVVFIESSLELTLGQRRAALARLQAATTDLIGNARTKRGAPGTTLEILHALVLYEGDALDQAKAMLDLIPAHALDLGGPDVLIAHRMVLARIALQHDDRPTWMRHLADLEQLGRRSGSERILCAAWLERARVATLEGRLDSAAQALATAELAGQWDVPEVLTIGCDTDTPFIARQRLLIARGEHALAASALSAALDTAEQRQHRRRALKLRVLLAMAQAGKGRQKQALETLTPALRLASQEGFVRTFVEEGPALLKLLERWAVACQALSSSLDIAPEFLANLLKRSGTKGEANEGVETADDLQLTSRELQVIRLLAAGNRNRAIADQMHLSEHTVKTHLRNISAKLGAQGRTEAVAIARARGLLD
ncbi:LuxR C-terminal-related transcriptional regulator [Pseudomonas sp. H9]|uniref:LuxR C-terminal-related transcriptional regulator n=1 Tax=Pseudomonas sp. H9 TaxID=483968 RepID=UPI001057EABA|nr:LuxR C-terminal-related transcriptional regulator [Pseudomonas sp. H9]TDF83757.1 helix-turn-helix transcriptional regulator [Pseudomonas sp. H9]